MTTSELYGHIKDRLKDELTNLKIMIKQNDLKTIGGEERQRFESKVERKCSQINILIKDLEHEVLQAPMTLRPGMNREVKRLKYDLDNIQRVLTEKQPSNSEVTFGSGSFFNPPFLQAPKAGDQSTILHAHKSLQRASESIVRSNVVAVESEDIGYEVLNNLDQQREQLIRTRDRLEDTHEELTRSQKILKSIKKNFIFNKIFLVIFILIELGILGFVVYFRHLRKT